MKVYLANNQVIKILNNFKEKNQEKYEVEEDEFIADENQAANNNKNANQEENEPL
jgi:hypothetical protein